MQKTGCEHTIKRRELLKTAASVSSLLAAGRLPLVAQAAVKQKKNNVPGAVRDITGHLRSFQPAKNGTLKPASGALFVYDILNWRGRNKRTGMTRHVHGGTVTIGYRSAGSEKMYKVKRVLKAAALNTITASLVCTGDRIASLKSWVMESTFNPPDEVLKKLASFKETGSVEEGKITVRRNGKKRTFSAENPVVTQWQLPALAASMEKEKKGVSFDLLQDCALFKPGHTLSFEGSIIIRGKGKSRIRLSSFLQTGRGILPTHFLVDEKGLVQLVTAGMLSWGLKSIETS